MQWINFRLKSQEKSLAGFKILLLFFWHQFTMCNTGSNKILVLRDFVFLRFDTKQRNWEIKNLHKIKNLHYCYKLKNICIIIDLTVKEKTGPNFKRLPSSFQVNNLWAYPFAFNTIPIFVWIFCFSQKILLKRRRKNTVLTFFLSWSLEFFCQIRFRI